MGSGDTTYDCFVLSGGGAKGAYEAGVAKSLMAYRRLKDIHTHLCYLGTSVGALNAAVLAMRGADDLVDFWRGVNVKSILGVKTTKIRGRLRGLLLLRRMLSGSAVYSNEPLRQLIQSNIKFEKLVGKHLVITATDFVQGVPKAFYHSTFLDAFIDEDVKVDKGLQRLSNYHRLDEQNLTDALLASCAIPVVFPLIDLCESLFIDGGVGNNTPTPQAAMFLRHLSHYGLGTPGETYCVLLEPHAFGWMAVLEEVLLPFWPERMISIITHIRAQSFAHGRR